MKLDHFTNKIGVRKHYLYCGILFVTALIGCMTTSNAQKTQTTENKADGSLKSSARVNPSTLAMEFSLPLGNYAGRAGNSIPFSLSYSSKLWTTKAGYVWHDSGQTGNPTLPFYYTQVNDIAVNYSQQATAGWTSSLRPPTILESMDRYNQFGELFNTTTISSNQMTPNVSGDGSGCQDIDEVIWDMSCGGWAHITAQVCYSPYDPVPEVSNLEVTCLLTPPPPPPTPVPAAPTPTPQIPYQVKRVNVEMPDGSTHEFRKDDTAYNCYTNVQDCSMPPFGTYLSVDGSGMRLERSETQPDLNNQPRDVLYMPDGSKYIFATASASNALGNLYLPAAKFVDKNGNIETFDPATRKWTDTMGREIHDPFPNTLLFDRPAVGTQPVTLKGISGADVQYQIVWKSSKMLLNKRIPRFITRVRNHAEASVTVHKAPAYSMMPRLTIIRTLLAMFLWT